MKKKMAINPFWFPFWVDKWLFGSTRLELQPDERSVWLDLLALASKNEGYIRANENVAYLNSQLAGLLVISEELLQRTIEKCIKHDKIIQTESGTYYIANWEKYQLSGRHKRRFKPKEKKSRVKKSREEKSIVENRVSKETDTVSTNEDNPISTWKDKVNKGVQEVIDYATSKGFGLQGSQKQNRYAASNLIKRKDPAGLPLGVERVKELIDLAVAVRGERFAPQVNDFVQLGKKWLDLMAFGEKRISQKGRIG